MSASILIFRDGREPLKPLNGFKQIVNNGDGTITVQYDVENAPGETEEHNDIISNEDWEMMQ